MYLTIKSAADCEKGTKLHPKDIVKMDWYNNQIVIQAIAFTLVMGNAHLPGTKLWNKQRKEHIVKVIDGKPYCVDLKTGWHLNTLSILQLVMDDLPDPVNRKLFGFKNYLEFEQGIKKNDRLLTTWLPQESIFLSKLSKLHSNLTTAGLKTTIKSHYQKEVKVLAHIYFLLEKYLFLFCFLTV